MSETQKTDKYKSTKPLAQKTDDQKSTPTKAQKTDEYQWSKYSKRPGNSLLVFDLVFPCHRINIM